MSTSLIYPFLKYSFYCQIFYCFCYINSIHFAKQSWYNYPYTLQGRITMNKKLQVFVSSTYTDLIEERQAAVEAILDAGHIPAGMELFKAGKYQIKTLQKQIDESDIYILILGGRYGSIEEKSGLSYIELEYRYALSKNMPIFTIILSESFITTKLALSPSTYIIETTNFNKYQLFKTSVMSRLIKIAEDYTDIKAAIYNILYNYNLLELSIELVELKKHSNISNDIRMYFLQNPNIFISLYNDKNLSQKIKYYYDVCENFKIKSISDITNRNCIVDPLGNPISDISNIRIDVSEINDWMLNELNKNPTDLYQLSSRRFEELVAEILMRKGYNIELTPATRDGGKDIYVARKDDLGSFLYLVECKRYNPNHKVGVNVIRDLYGVLSKERATCGIAVTTSYFSKPAKEFQQEFQFRMSLKDFDSIKQWLCEIT